MHWVVTTPNFLAGGWDEPYEYECDVTFVEAKTRRQAILAGVKKMRQPEFSNGYKTYYRWYWDQATNPYTGVKAEIAECEHGVCYCDLKDCEGQGDCDVCMLEADKACIHELHTGPIQRNNQPAVIETFCFNCLRSEDEINAWKIEEQALSAQKVLDEQIKTTGD